MQGYQDRSRYREVMGTKFAREVVSSRSDVRISTLWGQTQV